MPTAYTSLLGLAQPATGELSGTWGTTVNASLTQLAEDAIAGVATAVVTSADWTLSTTGSGATNEQRMAILIPTGTPGVVRNINAPKQSKIYCVINNSNASVVLKGGPTSPTTGVTIPAGNMAIAAWDGGAADFKFVSAPVNTAGAAINATNAVNLTGSGTVSSTTTGGAALSVASAVTANSSTTQSAKDSTTAIATTAFVDRLRSLLSSSTTGTLILSDRGCRVPITAGITVPASIFAADDVVTIYNNSAGDLTITQGGGLTMYLAGTATTGNRTIAQRGVATVVFNSGTECALSGAGVS